MKARPSQQAVEWNNRSTVHLFSPSPPYHSDPASWASVQPGALIWISLCTAGMQDVGKRIKLPRREGFGSFKPVLKSPASAELCTLFFWLVFAQRFRPQDKEIHAGIYNTLSERFVALFWALNNSAAKVRGRRTLGTGIMYAGLRCTSKRQKPVIRWSESGMDVRVEHLRPPCAVFVCLSAVV